MNIIQSLFKTHHYPTTSPGQLFEEIREDTRRARETSARRAHRA